MGSSSAALALAVAALAALAVLGTEASSKYTPNQKKHTRFHLYTANNAHLVKGPQIDPEFSRENIVSLGFNPNVPTSILIHGYANNVKSESMQILKNAFITFDKRNVVVVDWGDLDPAPLYGMGTANMEGVGARTAEFIDFLVKEELLTHDKLQVLGHSLGAHIAGIISEHLETGRLARITGLDPAMPLINMQKTTGRLSDDDADLVEVIHTNAGLLGTPKALGHVDLYPNGGRKQPGCGLDLFGSCSHGRSFHIWAESIVDPNAFKAELCDSSKSALSKRCKGGDLAIVGQHGTYTQNGAYYFETNKRSPFKRNV